jgi:hypothetical protein
MVGVKKDEINWGQVALLALGAVALVGGIAAVTGGGEKDSAASLPGGGTFEDNIGDFSARHGGGLNNYL